MHWSEKASKIVEERGLSYRQVERLASWTPNTLKTAIAKRSNVSVDRAFRLAAALGVPADWLFNGKDDWYGLLGTPWHADIKSLLRTMHELYVRSVMDSTKSDSERLRLVNNLRLVDDALLTCPTFDMSAANAYIQAVTAATNLASDPKNAKASVALKYALRLLLTA